MTTQLGLRPARQRVDSRTVGRRQHVGANCREVVAGPAFDRLHGTQVRRGPPRGSVQARNGFSEFFDQRRSQFVARCQPIKRHARIESLHPHRVFERLFHARSGSADDVRVRHRSLDGNHFFVELRRRPAIQPDLFLAIASTFFERRKIEEAKVDRLAQFVGMCTSEQHGRDVRVDALDAVARRSKDARPHQCLYQRLMSLQGQAFFRRSIGSLHGRTLRVRTGP